MSEREKVHTPRSLAAILNPDIGRPEGDQSRADIGAAESSQTDALPGTAWRTLRERVLKGKGTLELLLFRSGAEVFALPLDSVREAIDGAESHALPDMPPHVTGMLNLAGRSIPLYDEKEFLGVATSAASPSVLIVKGEPEDSGLAVDALMSSCVVEMSDIRRVPALEDAQGAFVGVFFHSGDLVALLDPAVFARQREQASSERNSPQ